MTMALHSFQFMRSAEKGCLCPPPLFYYFVQSFFIVLLVGADPAGGSRTTAGFPHPFRFSSTFNCLAALAAPLNA